MAGILMQVNADGSSWAGYTRANSIEEAQTQLDDDGETEAGTKLAGFVPFDQSDPAVRAFQAFMETVLYSGDVKLDELLTQIFEAGRKYGPQ